MSKFTVWLRGGAALLAFAACHAASGATDAGAGPTAAPVGGTAEAPARLEVSAPLAGPLAHGAVVVPFHAEHLQLAPVYGPAAANVSPRIGHLHLTLDNARWHWVQASPDLIVLAGLEAGLHTLRVELADAQHQVLDSRTVTFTVPQVSGHKHPS